jgi:hypothetical protein
LSQFAQCRTHDDPIWCLSAAGENNLGLACTADGLGRTPLIARRDERFVVRERREIERLFGRAFGDVSAAERIMPGLGVVARALDAKDQCLAWIAALHLRIPDLPDLSARNRMEAEDALIKYARGVSPRWFAPSNLPRRLKELSLMSFPILKAPTSWS